MTPSQQTKPLIICEQVTRKYIKGDNEIIPLQDLDLVVNEGEFLALMGPSGSGKSTLLNLIAGIDSPTSGNLIIDGKNLSTMNRKKLTEWRRDYIGYIFQLYNLVPTLTAYENIELPLLLHSMSGKQRHEKVSLALDLVGIADRHDHFPRQLSGGQEQRVAIARAIVSDPKILVADEPTGDLDGDSATAIMQLLTRLNSELNKTLIMVTHDQNCADYANRELFLDKGKLIDRKLPENSLTDSLDQIQEAST